MATRWTDAKIKALKLPEGRAERRVAIEPGLHLRIRASGDKLAKVFEYRAMVNGRQRRVTLGPVSDWFGLHLARAKVNELTGIAARARIGESDHPVLVERFRRQGRRSDPTIAELFEEFILDRKLGSPRKDGAPVRERTIEIHRHNFDSDIRNRIGDAKVATISREALEACVKAAQRRGSPGMAAHIHRTLRALVRFAIDQGRLAADPMAGMRNPKPYRPPRSAEEVVAANDTQLQALFRVLDESAVSVPVRLAIEFQLLTAARPTEVRLATWSEINLKQARWLIPASRTKSDRAFEVHLSGQAIALLRQAKKLPRFGDQVFPGQRGEDMDKMAVARALSRIADRVIEEGGRKLTPHDLRRTARTMMSRLGIAPHIAERCMNHLQRDALERIYDGHDHRAEMAEAWDKVGRHIAALKGTEV